MGFTRVFKYWSPVLLVMAFIFWMSTGMFSADNTSMIIGPLIYFFIPSVSPEQADAIHVMIRKAGHFTEYFFLGLLSFRAFRHGSTEKLRWQWVIYSVVLVVLCAAGDEFHQSFVSERTASFMDVGIDVTGGVFAQAASVAWRLGHRQE